jgi:hypothetical protein
MKIKLIIVAMLSFATVSHAGLMSWYSDSFGDPNTVTIDGVTAVDDWYVGLYTTDDTIWSGTQLDLYTDLVASTTLDVIFTPSFTAGMVTTYQDLDIADDIEVFTVIFNSDSLDTATAYIVVDATTFNSGSASGTDTAIDYRLTSINGTWQSVPEPATIGLFGLGALSAWFIRRSKKAQQEEV